MDGSDVVISPDTKRSNRIPPNQVQTHKWPVLHNGEIPPFDPQTWNFSIFPKPLVSEAKSLTWPEFRALPSGKVFGDMHCVTRWSLLNNLWEGVKTRELKSLVSIAPEAKFVMIHCEYGFTTNMPIDDFFDDDCIFAWNHNGQPLTPEHGYPLRLVIPKLYAWKSAKWVRGIEFMTEDRAGFWEEYDHGGYHMHGDPWVEERHR